MNELRDRFFIFRATVTKQVSHQKNARIHKYKREAMFRILFIAIFGVYQ
jgi:hypothetical protein